MTVETLTSLITGTGFVDAILVFMVLEGVVLIAYHWSTGRGIAPVALIANLLAGGGILLALRATLSGWGVGAVAACMALSFAAHLTDLQRRWRG
jgi:hypothetical protein